MEVRKQILRFELKQEGETSGVVVNLARNKSLTGIVELIEDQEYQIRSTDIMIDYKVISCDVLALFSGN